MWLIAFRDLQWRRRRFLIAIAATSLVFAMTLLLTGVSTSLHDQDRRIVTAFGADSWLVEAGASGPFTASRPQAADRQGRPDDHVHQRAAVDRRGRDHRLHRVSLGPRADP